MRILGIDPESKGDAVMFGVTDLVEDRRARQRMATHKWRTAHPERHLEVRRDWEHKNRDKILKKARRMRVENPEQRILTYAKARAKKKGMPFSLTLSDINIPKVCPVLGIKLCLTNTRALANSPSLDRLNSSLGYVSSNVHIISHKANSIKNDLTIEQAEQLVSYMKGTL